MNNDGDIPTPKEVFEHWWHHGGMWRAEPIGATPVTMKLTSSVGFDQPSFIWCEDGRMLDRLLDERPELNDAMWTAVDVEHE